MNNASYRTEPWKEEEKWWNKTIKELVHSKKDADRKWILLHLWLTETLQFTQSYKLAHTVLKRFMKQNSSEAPVKLVKLVREWYHGVNDVLIINIWDEVRSKIESVLYLLHLRQSYGTEREGRYRWCGFGDIQILDLLYRWHGTTGKWGRRMEGKIKKYCEESMSTRPKSWQSLLIFCRKFWRSQNHFFLVCVLWRKSDLLQQHLFF